MSHDGASGTGRGIDPQRVLVYFEGGRHDSREGMPLDALQELSAFQGLLIEVAREEWRQAYPESKRGVPSQVGESVELHLTKVEDGSSIPILRRDSALFDAGELSGIRERIVEILGYVTTNHEYPSVADSILTFLKRLGRGLSDDERMVVPTADGQSVVKYSRQHRDLAQEASRNAERPTAEDDLLGSIVKLVPQKNKFEFLTLAGDVVEGFYIHDDITEQLSEYLSPQDESGPLVKIHAGYSYILEGRPEKILNVTDVEFVLDGDAPWSSRLRQLGKLDSGWYNGEGARITVSSLRDAAALLFQLKRFTDRLPGIYPSPGGHVQLEYPGATSNLEVTVTGTGILEIYFLDLDSQEEVDEEVQSIEEAAQLLRRWLDVR